MPIASHPRKLGMNSQQGSLQRGRTRQSACESVCPNQTGTREAHAGGPGRGRLGRSGLNAIGRKILEEADVDQIILEGSTRTTGRYPGARQSLFDTPIDDVLIETATLPQPVEVARVLKRHGLSLRKAHEALNKLANTGTAIVAIPVEAVDQLTTDLLAFGVTVKRVSRPEG